MDTQLHEKLLQQVDLALEYLEKGEVILYPTDTIWGLGCDATNPEAVAKVYEIKQRDDAKSLIVLLDDFAKLHQYVGSFDEEFVKQLLEESSKPTTVIYPNASGIASNLGAEDSSLAIRITQETFSQELCKRFQKPIVSTSANISGQASPSCYAEIKESLKEKVSFVADYAREHVEAVPSRLLLLQPNKTYQVLRD